MIVNTLIETDSPVTAQSPLEAEVASLIVAALHLEIGAAEIAPQTPLFGEGLGLDSIDALELALAISRTYGLELKSDDERNRAVFGSLRSLAAFIGAQSVFKPRSFMGPKGVEATASDNLSARLPYMFAVCRFAHYLKVMIRDKVGSYREAPQLTRWLSEWINEYVDGDPINSTEMDKARKPLAAAAIEIVPIEENPGYYSAKFFLRPHFQLEGVDVGLSLVSKVPENMLAK